MAGCGLEYGPAALQNGRVAADHEAKGMRYDIARAPAHLRIQHCNSARFGRGRDLLHMPWVHAAMDGNDQAWMCTGQHPVGAVQHRLDVLLVRNGDFDDRHLLGNFARRDGGSSAQLHQGRHRLGSGVVDDEVKARADDVRCEWLTHGSEPDEPDSLRHFPSARGPTELAAAPMVRIGYRMPRFDELHDMIASIGVEAWE